MPFRKEHSVRLHDPKKYKSFARQNDKLGSGVSAVFGIKKSDGKSEIQALRFSTSKFKDMSAVNKWLSKHKQFKNYIKKEKAKPKNESMSFDAYCKMILESLDEVSINS